MLIKLKKRISGVFLSLLEQWSGKVKSESFTWAEDTSDLTKEKMERFVRKVEELKAEFKRVCKLSNHNITEAERELLMKRIGNRFYVLDNNIHFTHALARCQIADVCNICDGLEKRFTIIKTYLRELNKELLHLEFGSSIIAQDTGTAHLVH